jgi:hypothetical protein
MHSSSVSRFSIAALAAAVFGISGAASAAITSSTIARPASQGLDLVGTSVPIGGIAATPAAATLWDNLPLSGEQVTSTTSAPRTGGADEMLFNGNSAKITSMQFGYLIAAGGPAAFDAHVRFYDDINLSATTGQAQFSNKVADFTVALSGQTAGAFLTGVIDLTSLPGGGVTVTSNPSNLGVSNLIDTYMELDFYQPGTTTPVANNGVTYLFRSGGGEPNVGYTFGSAALGGTQANDLYWRDANGDGNITGDEGRGFAAPTRANWTVNLSGNVNAPEPMSAGLVFGGMALTLVRRRRA